MIEFDPCQVVAVDLKAPPKQRWCEAAEQTGDAVNEIVGDVVEYCEEYFESLPAWIRPVAKLATHGAASVTARLAGSIAGLYGQEYGTEIKSIARTVGVSFPQLLLGNLMYDISQMGERYYSASACSSYSCNLADGVPILARNMDWAIPESFGEHTTLIRFHHGRRNYTSVGVAGMVGVLSAMRAGHWAVTLNQAPVEKLGVRFQIPALQRLRQACDQFGGYRDLVRRIQQYQTMSPFFAHVVGHREDEHCVINGFGDSYSQRTMEEPEASHLIQTNHFLEEEFEDFNGADEWEVDGQIWMSDSKPRYRSLQRRLRRLPSTLDDAMGKLQRAPVTNQNTMQQMAFCPASGEWRLRVAE